MSVASEEYEYEEYSADEDLFDEEEIIEEIIIDDDDEYDEIEEEIIDDSDYDYEEIEIVETACEASHSSVTTAKTVGLVEDEQRQGKTAATNNFEGLFRNITPCYELAMDGDYDRIKGTLMGLKDQLEECDDASKKRLQVAITGYVNAKDVFGRSALFYACSQNSLSMAMLLLSPPFRANPNLLDSEGFPPIYVPCERGYLYIVQLLLQFGADANHKVVLDDGNEPSSDSGVDNPHAGIPSVATPLLAAIYLQRPKTAQLLLRNGANPNVVTETPLGKKSALELATEVVPNDEISKLLYQHNAMDVTYCRTATKEITPLSNPNDLLPDWMKRSR